MRRKAILGWVLGLVAGAGVALGAEIVGVLRGDVAMAKVGERVLGLRLAGVWVPTPPGLGEPVEYRGEEARQFAIEAMSGQRIRIEPLGRIRPGRPLRVRILVGEEDGRDLAVLLAEAGLALCERSTAANEEHAAAVYSAERKARAARRGMHDGGFQKFAAAQGRQELNLGLAVWLTGDGTESREVPGSGAEETGGSGAFWAESSPYEIHRTAVEAIRDWGRSMGLPPDHSNSGR